MENQEQKTGAEPKPAAPAEKKMPEKTERPKECTVCNKSIKNLWYYREGVYYCSKGCWKKSKKGK